MFLFLPSCTVVDAAAGHRRGSRVGYEGSGEVSGTYRIRIWIYRSIYCKNTRCPALCQYPDLYMTDPDLDLDPKSY